MLSNIFEASPGYERCLVGGRGRSLCVSSRTVISILGLLILLPIGLLAIPVSGKAEVLEKPLSIHGTVESPDGSPAPGVVVTLLHQPTLYQLAVQRLTGTHQDEPVAKTQTGENGRFTFQVEEEAVFMVRVQPPRSVPLTYAPVPVVGKVELPAARLSSAALLKIQLRRASDRLPIAKASVRAWTSSRSPVPGVPALENVQEGWTLATRLGQTNEQGRLYLPRGAGELVDVEILTRTARRPLLVEAVKSVDTLIGSPETVKTHPAILVLDANGTPAEGVVLSQTDGDPLGITDARGMLAPLEKVEPGTSLQLLTRQGIRATVTLATDRTGRPSPVFLPAVRSVKGKVSPHNLNQWLPTRSSGVARIRATTR